MDMYGDGFGDRGRGAGALHLALHAIHAVPGRWSRRPLQPRAHPLDRSGRDARLPARHLSRAGRAAQRVALQHAVGAPRRQQGDGQAAPAGPPRRLHRLRPRRPAHVRVRHRAVPPEQRRSQGREDQGEEPHPQDGGRALRVPQERHPPHALAGGVPGPAQPGRAPQAQGPGTQDVARGSQGQRHARPGKPDVDLRPPVQQLHLPRLGGAGPEQPDGAGGRRGRARKVVKTPEKRRYDGGSFDVRGG